MITEMKLIGKTAVVLGLALSFSNAYADFEKSYTTDDPIIQDEVHEGQTYSVISGKILSDSESWGKPGVPSVTLTFYIPQGEKVSDVVFVANQTKNVTLKHKLLPVQEAISTGENIIRFTQPDNTVYGSSNAYPSKRVSFSGEKGVGSVKMVQVTVNPMTYYPQKNKLSVATSYTVKVKTVSDTKSSSAKCSIKESDVDGYVKFVKQIVNNPEMVENDLATTLKSQCNKATLRAGSADWGIPFYEYVLITKRDFIPAFEKLLTWKRQKGLNAGAVAIEDILSKVPYGNEIQDNAGKVRNYLKASYDKGGKYVLIGGGTDIVPARTARLLHNEKEQDTVPTDYYYTDLCGAWETRNEEPQHYECYGLRSSLRSMNDIRPEKNGAHLYVGRILCLSASDIQNWISKQLIYEQNPGFGSNSYLDRVLVTQSDQMQQAKEAQKAVKPYSQWESNCTFIEEDPCERTSASRSPNGPTGTAVIEMLNTTKYGIYSNYNHGSPRDYAVEAKKLGESDTSNYNVCSYDDVDKCNTCGYFRGGIQDQKKNGFDNLTNYAYPFVIYTISCSNMPFDDYGDYKSKYGIRNLGESLLFNAKGGGIAYLGNTRQGITRTSSDLHKCFTSFVTRHNQTKEGCKLGILEYESKQEYNDKPYIIAVHNLLGCPETTLWTKKPSKLKSNSVSYNSSTKKLKVVFKPTIAGGAATVCVTSKSDGGKTSRSVKSVDLSNTQSKTVTFDNAPEDYVVVVTSDAHLPWIEGQGCFIQNETFTTTEVYDGCYDINVGREVTTSKPHGDVILKSGSNVTIDATHNTTLQGGVYVKKGATLNIK